MRSELSVYQTSLSPSLRQIKTVRSEVAAVLTKFTLCEQKKNNVLLALSEYLTNLVKHATPQATKAVVSIVNENKKLIIKIRDDGGFFPGLTRHCSGHQSPVFAESGMGVDILFHLFPHLSYTEDSGWNCCQFITTLTQKISKQFVAVVDDEPMQRELLTSYLSGDYDVICYEDARSFLSGTSEYKFDLVLCDIEMPEMNGLELKRTIKQGHVASLVPFIFLTGNEDPKIESAASELGIDNFLTKPIRKEKLILAIDRVLTRNQEITNRHNDALTNALKPVVYDNNPYFQMSARSYSPNAGGGDFIVQKTVEDKTFVVLADVMGHDVTSKLFAHSFDGFIKGLMEQGRDIHISDVFSTLSRQVFEDPMLNEMLLTCIGIELTEDYLDIVCAGHPAPLLINRKGTKFIEVLGQLPGLCSETSYQTARVKMTKGERLLVYTDGLSDSFSNEQSSDGFPERISEVTRAAKLGETEQQVTNIFSSLLSQNPPPEDDVTVIILEKR